VALVHPLPAISPRSTINPARPRAAASFMEAIFRSGNNQPKLRDPSHHEPPELPPTCFGSISPSHTKAARPAFHCRHPSGQCTNNYTLATQPKVLRPLWNPRRSTACLNGNHLNSATIAPSQPRSHVLDPDHNPARPNICEVGLP
jgi:hypothetical protein